MMDDPNNQSAEPDILIQATDSLLASEIPAEPSQEFQLATLQLVEECRRKLVSSPVSIEASIGDVARASSSYNVTNSSAHGQTVIDSRSRSPLGWWRLTNRITRSAMIAVTVVMLIGGLWLILGHGSATAFAAAIDKVAEHEAVRFRVQSSSNGQVLRTCVGTVSGHRARVDGLLGPGTSWIIDNDARAALIVNHQSKIYQKIDMTRLGIVPVEVLGADIRQELLGLRDKATERMGKEQIDGVTADRYVTRNGKAFYIQGDWNVWISRDSGLPVRVSVESNMPPSVKMSNVYDSFEWDPKIDAETFSLKPPEGYQERKLLGVVSELELAPEAGVRMQE